MNLDFTYAEKWCFCSEEERQKIDAIKKIMNQKQEMLDWLDVESCIDEEEKQKILLLANEIRKEADVFLVIGIGGSYLGSKAVIEALKPYFDKGKPEILFAGYHLSASYLKELLTYLEGKSVYVNVISKSGETLEPSIAFQKIYQYMKKHFSDYEKRIVVTTDKEKGNLRRLAEENHLETLTVPRQIGGRYSVLSSVGLFPIAVSGIDIHLLLDGAKENRNCFEEAAKYALTRKHLEEDGYQVEALTIYEEKLSSFASWAQQLFAETQGKKKKGILPLVNLHTTNLHSIGQYLQQGTKNVFETVWKVEKTEDLELEGYSLSMGELNHLVLTQVMKAHQMGNTPSILLTFPELSEKEVGKFIYFEETAAAIGGYLLDVPPFDQPGVEAYKKLVNEELKKYKR